MDEEKIIQNHAGVGDNVKEKNVEDKSVKGNSYGIVVTGDGNTIYVKEDHIILEDYDISKSNVFNTLFSFDKKCIDNIYIEPSFQVNYFSLITYEYEENQVKDSFLETIQKLIENKNIIYILGKYGTGKTILLKKIYNFLKTNYDVYFLEMKTIVDVTRDRQLTVKKSDKTRIFIIDGLDDSNSNNIKFKQLVENILRLANYTDLKFIFGTRLYMKGNEDIALGLAGEYADLIKDHKVPFVEINYFRRPMIKTWLEKYYPDDDRMELTLKEIEKADKRLFSLSQIPIFLYQLSSYFYDENIEVLKKEKIYEVYKTFITRTVKGKFSQIHKAVEYEEKYKTFLMKIAIMIFENNYKANNFKKYTENIDDQLLSEHFAISNNEVETVINSMDIGIIGENIDKVNNAINCYFFEKINYDFWIFSNTNILLYLISEYYLVLLRKWLQGVDIQDDFKLYLDKTIFEYLIQLLKSREYENLYLRLIGKIELLRSLDNELTDLEYFMGLLYISYDGEKLKLPSILGKIYMYCKSKYDDKNYLYLLYSSFQSVNIEDIEFIDINFSDYNFSYSKFRNITFKNCDFSKDTIFNSVGFDNICFDNCTLRNTTFKNIVNSTISFLNCTLNGVRMERIKESLMSIEGDNSKVLRLELHKFEKSVKVEFINVKKGQSLIIKEHSKSSLKFTDTAFDKINLVRSTIYLEQQNCKLNIKKEGISKIINE